MWCNVQSVLRPKILALPKLFRITDIFIVSTLLLVLENLKKNNFDLEFYACPGIKTFCRFCPGRQRWTAITVYFSHEKQSKVTVSHNKLKHLSSYSNFISLSEVSCEQLRFYFTICPRKCNFFHAGILKTEGSLVLYCIVFHSAICQLMS